MSELKQNLPPIMLKNEDFSRIEQLVSTFDGGPNAMAVIDYLEREIMRAEILDDTQFPDDVVTMWSQVGYVDNTTGESRQVTLVYPHEADIAQNKISVLTPIGAALIGMRANQSISWFKPGGKEQTLQVVSVKQP